MTLRAFKFIETPIYIDPKYIVSLERLSEGTSKVGGHLWALTLSTGKTHWVTGWAEDFLDLIGEALTA